MRHVGVDVFLDRKHIQDEVTGLGQGVTDNKYTKETFEILIERKPFQNRNVSLKSQIESIKQLNPFYSMHHTSEVNLRDVNLIQSPFTCYLHLFNFRENHVNTGDNFHLCFIDSLQVANQNAWMNNNSIYAHYLLT
ncbi:alpha-mannosidase 2-like protein, partial [Leptotrombidium deliense]